MAKRNLDRCAEQIDRSQTNQLPLSEKIEGERLNKEKMGVCEAGNSSFNAKRMSRDEKEHEREQREQFCLRKKLYQQQELRPTDFPIETDQASIRQPPNDHIQMGPTSFSSKNKSSSFDLDEEGTIYCRQLSGEDSEFTNQEQCYWYQFHRENNIYIESDEYT